MRAGIGITITAILMITVITHALQKELILKMKYLSIVLLVFVRTSHDLHGLSLVWCAFLSSVFLWVFARPLVSLQLETHTFVMSVKALTHWILSNGFWLWVRRTLRVLKKGGVFIWVSLVSRNTMEGLRLIIISLNGKNLFFNLTIIGKKAEAFRNVDGFVSLFLAFISIRNQNLWRPYYVKKEEETYISCPSWRGIVPNIMLFTRAIR